MLSGCFMLICSVFQFWFWWYSSVKVHQSSLVGRKLKLLMVDSHHLRCIYELYSICKQTSSALQYLAPTHPPTIINSLLCIDLLRPDLPVYIYSKRYHALLIFSHAHCTIPQSLKAINLLLR